MPLIFFMTFEIRKRIPLRSSHLSSEIFPLYAAWKLADLGLKIDLSLLALIFRKMKKTVRISETSRRKMYASGLGCPFLGIFELKSVYPRWSVLPWVLTNPNFFKNFLNTGKLCRPKLEVFSFSKIFLRIPITWKLSKIEKSSYYVFHRALTGYNMAFRTFQ